MDLAQDSAPRHPATVTFAGPTFAPEELAGRKVLALFDRAAARDFVDVFTRSRPFDRPALLDLAADIDPGFDRHLLGHQLRTLDRFTDAELPLDAELVQPLRTFVEEWAAEPAR